MIALVVIIRQVGLEHRAKGRLSSHAHLMQSFLSNQAHEAFAADIEVRTPWRQDDGLQSAGVQRAAAST